jgi:predicted CoA-binding protein
MSAIADIHDFLGRKRIAVVGVSRNAKDFTRLLFREFRLRGYDALPVNPAVSEVDGVSCYRSVAEIAPGAEAALLLTKPEVTESVIEDCLRAGIKSVWFYRATGKGAVSPRASALCREHGIRVVEGECPFMFLPKTGLIHRIHGSCRKLFGRYPS